MVSSERLRGGSKKGVYRLALDDGTSCVAYLWGPDEDYWPATETATDDPFGHASGLALFQAAHRTLSGIGVRVPKLLDIDEGRAIVEDVRGGSLEALARSDPARADAVTTRLAEMVRMMHRVRSDHYGRPGARLSAPAEDVVLHRATADLADAAARVERIAAVATDVADLLRQRRAAVPPRASYGLIHGELGPDHVLIDDRGEPVMVDIEGVMWFDTEWEHVFLALRFGDRYRHFHADDLDESRVRLYRPALSLSLVAGPLRLLDGTFPDRAGMLEIVAHNTERVLAELR